MALANSDCRLTTGLSVPEYPLAGTTIGIVKWKSDPDRQRLSADNEVICAKTQIGRNCYRYREMELRPWQTVIVGLQRANLRLGGRWRSNYRYHEWQKGHYISLDEVRLELAIED